LDDAINQWQWKRVSMHMVGLVTLNTCRDVACLTFKLPQNTTRALHSQQCHTTQDAFQRHHQTNEFRISQVVR